MHGAFLQISLEHHFLITSCTGFPPVYLFIINYGELLVHPGETRRRAVFSLFKREQGLGSWLRRCTAKEGNTIPVLKEGSVRTHMSVGVGVGAWLTHGCPEAALAARARVPGPLSSRPLFGTRMASFGDMRRRESLCRGKGIPGHAAGTKTHAGTAGAPCPALFGSAARRHCPTRGAGEGWSWRGL